jgi:2-iminoacetate synthase
MSTKMTRTNAAKIINEEAIGELLCGTTTAPETSLVLDVLAKAKELKGLDARDVTVLATLQDPELLAELFRTAKEIKENIYGQRMVIFSPLYISNLCKNECLYCAFRAKNKALKRRTLSQNEIRNETEISICLRFHCNPL